MLDLDAKGRARIPPATSPATNSTTALRFVDTNLEAYRDAAILAAAKAARCQQLLTEDLNPDFSGIPTEAVVKQYFTTES
jgi:predicted nucleic acid-binding protein